MAEVEMYWWNGRPNFGDALNPIIVERLFGIHPRWADVGRAALFGAGSILQILAREPHEEEATAPRDVHVWGTGYIYDREQPIDNPRVIHHAVRGKRTQEFGRIAGAVALGDPGILSPLLVDEAIGKQYAIGIVPHYKNQNDDKLQMVREQRPDIKVIDAGGEPLDVVKQIASCDFIFSSSLHGLIVADGFNIPNQWVEFTQPVGMGGQASEWKFQDYYSAFGIDNPESLQFDMPLVADQSIGELAGDYVVRPGISEMQNNLARTFPF